MGLTNALRTKLLADYPAEAESIQNFALSAAPLQWTDAQQVQFEVMGEVPKSEDAFFFDGTYLVKVPGPQTAQIVTEAKITANAVGGIKVGMTVNQARAVMPEATFTRVSDGEGIALISVEQAGDQVLRLFADEYDPEGPIDDSAKISLIEVLSPAYRTEDEVHVGMTIEDAEAIYGEVTEIMMSEIESREYVEFTNSPSGLFFRVTGESGEAGVYPEMDNLTQRYHPGATLLVIEVSGGSIMQDGRIGGIRIDAPEVEVMALAEQQGFGRVLNGEDQIWEAFGQAVQEWLFPEVGLSVQMLSDEIGGSKVVYSIEVKAPTELKTGLGIAMGTPKADVVRAYADYRTEEDEMGIFEGQDIYLVDSIYGGMIFTFTDGVVSGIFLGAAAE